MAMFSAAVPASEDALLERYAAAVQQQVQINWMLPQGVETDAVDCVLLIDQAVGGEVEQVQLEQDCSSNPAVQDSLQRAVWRASPLPYAGFEAVFNPRLRIHFSRNGGGL